MADGRAAGEARDDAFVEFAAARRPTLVRAAYLLCGDRHRAEDLVQQTMTKLYLAWPRASRAGSVEAYARRILLNVHLDEVRRPWWRRERTVPELPDPPDADRDETTWSGEVDALRTALSSLAPGQRKVVVLRHYLGLSVEETAADLGVSAGTVKSQTSAALAHLRAALTEAPEPTATTDATTDPDPTAPTRPAAHRAGRTPR